MAGFGDTVENNTLDFWLRSVVPTTPTGGTTRKISLHTADPGDTGASEVTGGSYARQNGTFAAASGGSSALSAAVDFTGMPACTVTHFGVWDSAGTPLYIGGGPTTNRTLQAGDTYQLTTSTVFSLD